MEDFERTEQSTEQATEQQAKEQGYRPAVEPIAGVSYYVPANEKKAGDTLALVSMILGIISAASALLCCCCGEFYITGVLGLAAIICAVIAKKKGVTKKGKSTAGLVLGIIGTVAALLFGIFTLVISLTGGAFMWEMLIPIYEAAGIDTSELQEIIDSGADPEAILEWLENAAAQLENMPVEAKISGFLFK